MGLDRKKIKTIEVPENERAEIKKKILKQIEDWGLRLPDVSCLMLHFGLNDFYRIGETEFWIANEIEAGYCGKYLFVFDGQTCPAHHHKKKHETFFVVKGRIKMEYDNTTRELNSGDTLTVRQGMLHSFCGIGPALLLELSMPCIIDDNYFQNTDIPIGENYKGNKA